jgi:regulator of replication initiation timing
MRKGNETTLDAKPSSDELEPYRRLVELQKQVTELAQQNEKARQECAALRERLADEVIGRLHSHRGLRERLRLKANAVMRLIYEQLA